MLFCRITGRGVASTRCRRACDGRPGAANPPRAAAISRAEGSYKGRRIETTRSHTPWARGPANLFRQTCGSNMLGREVRPKPTRDTRLAWPLPDHARGHGLATAGPVGQVSQPLDWRRIAFNYPGLMTASSDFAVPNLTDGSILGQTGGTV